MNAEESRTIDWRRVARGVLWMGFGVFFLLTTTGVLPGGFWIRVLAFWPVLLIGAGLRIIFQKSRAPWLVLLSPAVILSTLGWVAMTEPSPSGAWSDIRAPRPEGVERWSLEGTLALAGVDITARPLPSDLLIDGRFLGRREREPRVTHSNGEARVRFTEPERRFHFVTGVRLKQRWDLDLTNELPLGIDLDMALTDTDLDLSGVRLDRAQFDGAFNRITLRLDAPEEDVRLEWDGAFNAITLIVPEDTPVRVSRDGFVSITHGRGRGERSGPGYRVMIDGAFNHLRVRSD